MLSRLLPLSFAAVALAACSTTDDPVLVKPVVGETHPRVLNGIPSTDDQDSAVMMFHLFKGTDGKERGNVCTAVVFSQKPRSGKNHTGYYYSSTNYCKDKFCTYSTNKQHNDASHKQYCSG